MLFLFNIKVVSSETDKYIVKQEYWNCDGKFYQQYRKEWVPVKDLFRVGYRVFNNGDIQLLVGIHDKIGLSGIASWGGGVGSPSPVVLNYSVNIIRMNTVEYVDVTNNNFYNIMDANYVLDKSNIKQTNYGGSDKTDDKNKESMVIRPRLNSYYGESQYTSGYDNEMMIVQEIKKVQRSDVYYFRFFGKEVTLCDDDLNLSEDVKYPKYNDIFYTEYSENYVAFDYDSDGKVTSVDAQAFLMYYIYSLSGKYSGTFNDFNKYTVDHKYVK